MSPNAQRIGIFVIAIIMIVSTLGLYATMVLSDKNARSEQERLLAEQDKLFDTFKQYRDDPVSFDASAVGDSVTKKDLKEGTGAVITKTSSYEAYYIGWNPDGEVFDSSFAGDSLKPPLNPGQMSLIPGWYDGVEGMKVGGIREITIPSSLAYGESGSGESIPPNTPIKFIIMTAEAGRS